MRKSVQVNCRRRLAWGLQLGLAASASVPLQAHAHGGVELKDDVCARKLGANSVHFNAYQPDIDVKGHYCFDIPGSGKTFVVVDLVGSSLRSTPTGMQIRKAPEGDSEGALVFESEPALHTSGVIESVADYEPGVYEAVVRSGGDSPSEQRMRFVIGKAPGGSALRLVSLGLAASLLGFLAYTKLSRRSHS